jgi:uncharacterized protein YbaP (TraB family)
MIAALIAAASTAMWTPSIPPQRAIPDARPALWVVNDEDTIIYLFGTFHALDGRSCWFNDEVMTAFTASDELILETIIPEPGMPATTVPPLTGPRIGPVGPFAGSASFLSTSKAVMSAGRSQGMSIDAGADTVLRNAAQVTGKPVAGLESFDYQLSMFSKLPGASQSKAAPATTAAVQTKAVAASLLTRLQTAWTQGDTNSFAAMLDQMQSKSPETYKLLFLDRNARWAGWIANRLQQPGTVFVAVGAGHLAGRDSVQMRLADLRIRSQRIN